jgi:hypothetical protein
MRTSNKMLKGCPHLLLLLLVVIAVSITSDSVGDLKISRTNASREVISGWRQLAVAEDRPACLIVAYDKIKGHLNWMQVGSKRQNFVHRLGSSYRSLSTCRIGFRRRPKSGVGTLSQ